MASTVPSRARLPRQRPAGGYDGAPGDRTATLTPALTAAFFGAWLALLPAATVTIALRVQEIDPAGRTASLGVVLGVGAAVALVAQNMAGALSDRTTSRFGMRRPWIVAGAVTGAGGLGLLAAAETVAALTLAWAATQLCFNLTLAGLNPVLADQFPAAVRGRVAGLVSLTAPAAILAGAYLAAALPDVRVALVLPGIVALAGAVWLALVLRDRTLAARPRAPVRPVDVVRAFWVDPRRSPDFAWAWLSRLLIFVGTQLLLTYQVYFVQDRLGVSSDEAPATMLQVLLVSTVGTVVAAPVLGALSDRLQRRKVLVLASAALLALSHVVALAAPDIGVFLVAAAINGTAFGCYLSVDLALVTDVLPRPEDAGKDMAVFHLANVVPQVLVPLVAPVLLALGAGAANYEALFITAAGIGLLGALCILPVRGVR